MQRIVSNASYLAEEYIKSGAWTPRRIGWLMRMPSDQEYGYEELQPPPLFVIAGQDIQKMIQYMPGQEIAVSSDAILELAEIFKDLTDEKVNEIHCDEIQAPGRKHFDQVVYFGPQEDFEVGQKA